MAQEVLSVVGVHDAWEVWGLLVRDTVVHE